MSLRFGHKPLRRLFLFQRGGLCTLISISAGTYAVCIVHIQNDTADFTHLPKWLQKNRYSTDAVYAEEVGLQLLGYIDDYNCEVKAHLIKNQK